MPLTHQTISRLASIGFTFDQTGGNCSAFVKSNQNGSTSFLTLDHGDPEAPSEIWHPVALSTFDDGVELHQAIRYKSLDVFLASRGV